MGGRRYPKEMLPFIRDRCDKTCSQILKEVNEEFHVDMTLGGLYSYKNRNGLKSVNTGQWSRGKRTSPQTEFKKGHIPWNKGKPHPSAGRSMETQFKKGNMPPNYMPVGSERLSYGVILIKIADPNVWEWLNILIWQSVHKQALPKGYIVRFADGDKTNYSPDNLVAVSRAQNAVINHLGIKTYDRESLEIAKTIANLSMEKERRRKHARKRRNKDQVQRRDGAD